MGPNAGLLSVWVPEDAKVYVNGHLTKSLGSYRQFLSNGLTPGLSYKFEIRPPSWSATAECCKRRTPSP